MSNVLLEAMACGLPIIATDIGGNVELIGEKIEEIIGDEGARYFICVNGILVPPREANSLAEAIMRLLKDRPLAERMGYSARKKVEEFYALSHVTERYVSLYRGL
jgi:glycosyltransferase involved in cell wall biosynthesis